MTNDFFPESLRAVDEHLDNKNLKAEGRNINENGNSGRMGNSGGRIRVHPLEGDAANLEGGAEGG